MGKAIVITSGKGGTGKTSMTGGIAAALYYLFLEPKLEHPAQPQEENHDKTDADR